MKVAKLTVYCLPNMQINGQSLSLYLDKRTIFDLCFLHRNQDDDLKLQFSSRSSEGLGDLLLLPGFDAPVDVL